MHRAVRKQWVLSLLAFLSSSPSSVFLLWASLSAALPVFALFSQGCSSPLRLSLSWLFCPLATPEHPQRSTPSILCTIGGGATPWDLAGGQVKCMLVGQKIKGFQEIRVRWFTVCLWLYTSHPHIGSDPTPRPLKGHAHPS